MLTAEIVDGNDTIYQSHINISVDHHLSIID